MLHGSKLCPEHASCTIESTKNHDVFTGEKQTFIRHVSQFTSVGRFYLTRCSHRLIIHEEINYTVDVLFLLTCMFTTRQQQLLRYIYPLIGHQST
jgi:hypothetical protein